MLLKLEDVTKRFGGLLALNKFDMTVKKGEIVGLIGPNGAGKTTAYNVITGVYPPDGGTIQFNGETITKFKPWNICKKGIARTFQLVKPFLNMTVLENTMVGALVRTNDVEEAREKAEKILEFVGLHEKRNLHARVLNLVDRKLMEVARSLSTEPTLLLLDEAMAGLNPAEIDVALKLFREIRDTHGITLVVVEHVMRAVMGLSERIVVIHEGRRIAEGTPKEVSKEAAVITAYLGTEAL